MKQARPRVTAEMVLEAARNVAAKIDADAETIAKHYRHPMDGYELARELEKYAYWDVSRDVMEQLDDMEWEVRRIHDSACHEWEKEHAIEPPLPIGATIKQGVIAGICDHSVATYRVKEHGCTQDGRYLLIKFEDAMEAQ